jgi:hypothetical protein
MDDQTLINANRILLRFVTDIEAKVRYGARMRQAMFDAMNRGEEPKGYRIDFINRTANQAIGWLAERAAEFNAKHPQDRISTDDFADILATAHARLRARTSGQR